MAKPQFNQRQKDISRLVRDQRMRQGERLKAKGGFSPHPSFPKKGGKV